jgi:hypothetical protein
MYENILVEITMNLGREVCVALGNSALATFVNA